MWCVEAGCIGELGRVVIAVHDLHIHGDIGLLGRTPPVGGLHNEAKGGYRLSVHQLQLGQRSGLGVESEIT
jgi:hypothetical protein